MDRRSTATRSEPPRSVRPVRRGEPDPLQAYRGKRNFSITSEPEGQKDEAVGGSFVVQKHWASRLHYDFRLEVEGAMKSWAVPKGPSLDPTVKRMAVAVEDHPVSYASFEGTIPAGQYGAGRVIVWDQGQWRPVGDPGEGLKKGHLKFDLIGHKLRGRWALVRLKKQEKTQQAWLLIKERDGFARPAVEFNVVDARPDSVNASAHSTTSRAPTTTTEAWPEGAVRSALPEQLAPQLATQADQPPADGQDWLYEIKFDGYRMLARINGAQVKLFTRNGHDWTQRLVPLQTALADLHLPNGWYDGEIVVPGADGTPDFGALQQSFDNGRTSEVVFHVFDLPHVDGHDLTNVPLVQRRELLQRVLASSSSSRQVRLTETFEGVAVDVLQAACKLGLEGVVAKRADSLYRSARSTNWLKLKCGQRQEFVIGGFTEGKGSRASLGALLLGVHDDQGLRHVGNVGTGFSQAGLAALLKRLGPLQRSSSPFSTRPKPPGVVHWTRPELVAEVAFSGWTREGRVRHSTFLGLRDDKPAAAVQREHPLPAGPPTSGREPSGKTVPARVTTSSSVRITHPERVIDPGTGATKLDLFQHYESVGAVMLEHVKQRPLALLRAPEGVGGETFFQKHLTSPLAGITQLDPALSPGNAPWITVAVPTGLLSAAQFNVVEFHTQNVVARSIKKPNRLVFDLNPGEGVAWEQVQEAAELTRALLTQLGLPCLLKTSGGKGLHVVVPIRQQHGWDQAKGFSQAVVQHMSQVIPQRFVDKSGPKNRVGKIFVDYLRNGLGATTVSAWSARARPGLGVSVPVAWSELATLRGGDHWNIRNIHERLSTGNAPWHDQDRPAPSLTAAMKQLGYTP